MFRLTIALVLAALISACSQDDQQAEQKPAQTTAQANPHPNMAGHPPMGQATQSNNAGKVVFMTEASGYKYIRVQAGNQFAWIAANQADVAVGDTVRWGQYAVMPNFHSKALNRTFDQIMFTSTVVKADPAALAEAGGNVGKVVSALNSAGYSYLEVQQQGQKSWIAAPQVEVKVGDTVSWSGGNVMHNFTSPSLNRTFDQIIFAGGVSVVN